MIRSIFRAACAAAILCLFALPLSGQAYDITFGNLTLAGAFARAMPPTAKVGGGYVSITNNGTEADRLLLVSSPAAPRVQLHEVKMDGDVMKMGEVPDGIVIPAGETVSLAPGGLHIMFINVHVPFAEGNTVPVTLVFEKAGSVEVRLHVEAIGATEMRH